MYCTFIIFAHAYTNIYKHTVAHLCTYEPQQTVDLMTTYTFIETSHSITTVYIFKFYFYSSLIIQFFCSLVELCIAASFGVYCGLWARRIGVKELLMGY